jgi:ATP-binding cassette subfamily F protein 3
MLQISDLTYRIGGRTLLDGAGVQVPSGWRVGLVGRNGAGKSTLLKLIRGEIQPESGTIALPRGARVGSLAQETPSGPASLLDTVLAADTRRATLLAEAEHATDPHRIAEIQVRLHEIGAHSAEARASGLLAGLGFDAAGQARPLDSYSGGWRMRVGLAAALFADPDLLLLDEPTNHLDLETTLWLTRYLKTWPRSLILVSHDRDLLNQVPQAILHLDAGRLARYRAGYDTYVRQRAEAQAQAAAARARQVAERQRIQAFVDRFRAKATKARQAQSRLKMLERMEPIAVVEAEEVVRLDFPEPEELAPPLLTLNRAAVGYGDTPVLRGLDLQVEPDDRIALLGANGNGKSTLAKLLAGRLQPMAGEYARHPKLRVGYFAQHQLDELVPDDSAYRHMAARMPRALEPQVRAQLGRFGFSQERADVAVRNLSGGEKARLTLALITYDAPHVLVLDEPTNHLDIETREALIGAINAYPGVVVLISHDRHLLDLTADELWLVVGGTVRRYDGDLDSYRAELGQGGASTARAGGNGATGDVRKDARRQAADARLRLAPLRKTAREAEALVARLTAEKATFEAQLADPALYSGPPARLTELTRQRAELNRRIAEAETRWLEAEEALEEEAF